MNVPIRNLQETHDRLTEMLKKPQGEYLLVTIDPKQKISTIKKTISERLILQEKMNHIRVIVNISAMSMKKIEYIAREVSRTLNTFLPDREITCDIFTLPSSTFIEVRNIFEKSLQKAKAQLN